MAFVAGRRAVVLYGKVDLTSYFREYTGTSEVDIPDTTTFGETARRRSVVGLRNGSMGLSGFFDPVTDGSDEELQAALAAANPTVVTVGKDGIAVGARVDMLSARKTRYSVSAPVDGVVAVAADVVGDGGLEYGKSHHALAAETVTGNSASVDNLASSANGGVGHVHCTAASGTAPTLAAIIQHSTDDSVFVDLINFTQLAVAGSERKAVTGTVNRYTRNRHVIAGTGPSFTFSDCFARR